MRTRLSLLLVFAAGCSSTNAADTPDLTVAPYTVPVLDDARIVSDGAQANFQKVRRDVDFGAGPFQRVTLIVDLTSRCYPFEGWITDPPPAGQRWPADCDAFDRNFEITLDEPATPDGPPAIELMRAITPFGGPLHEELDVTDVVNGLRAGPHTVQAFIATYSDPQGLVSGSAGGWNVSVRFEVVPGPAPRRVLAVLPLWNGAYGPASSPSASFTLPAGTTATRVEYRATGHGGASERSVFCIGPAEEFCMRTHHLLVDGSELEPGLTPWRTDCDQLCTVATYRRPSGSELTYCMENPTGDMDSVRAPRANWCPGSLTPPFTWEPMLSPGAHALSATVDGVHDGGSWRLSAVVLAFGN